MQVTQSVTPNNPPGGTTTTTAMPVKSTASEAVSTNSEYATGSTIASMSSREEELKTSTARKLKTTTTYKMDTSQTGSNSTYTSATTTSAVKITPSEAISSNKEYTTGSTMVSMSSTEEESKTITARKMDTSQTGTYSISTNATTISPEIAPSKTVSINGEYATGSTIAPMSSTGEESKTNTASKMDTSQTGTYSISTNATTISPELSPSKAVSINSEYATGSTIAPMSSTKEESKITTSRKMDTSQTGTYSISTNATTISPEFSPSKAISPEIAPSKAVSINGEYATGSTIAPMSSTGEESKTNTASKMDTSQTGTYSISTNATTISPEFSPSKAVSINSEYATGSTIAPMSSTKEESKITTSRKMDTSQTGTYSISTNATTISPEFSPSKAISPEIAPSKAVSINGEYATGSTIAPMSSTGEESKTNTASKMDTSQTDTYSISTNATTISPEFSPSKAVSINSEYATGSTIAPMSSTKEEFKTTTARKMDTSQTGTNSLYTSANTISPEITPSEAVTSNSEYATGSATTATATPMNNIEKSTNNNNGATKGSSLNTESNQNTYSTSQTFSTKLYHTSNNHVSYQSAASTDISKFSMQSSPVTDKSSMGHEHTSQTPLMSSDGLSSQEFTGTLESSTDGDGTSEVTGVSVGETDQSWSSTHLMTIRTEGVLTTRSNMSSSVTDTSLDEMSTTQVNPSTT